MLFLSSAAVINAPITTPYFLQHVLPSLWERLAQLAAAPVSSPEMLWIAIPLVATLFTMEFYFGRYLGPGTDGGGRAEFQDMKKGVRAVLHKVKYLASPVERAHWLHELGTRTGIQEAALVDELALIRQDLKKSDFREAAPAAESETALSRHERIAGRLFGFACAGDEYREKLIPHEQLSLRN